MPDALQTTHRPELSDILALLRGELLGSQTITTFHNQALAIISGTFFLIVGLTACGIAAMRRQSGVRLLVWVGIWSAMYGARLFASSVVVLGFFPHWFQAISPYLDMTLMYFILVVATLAWRELSLGKLRNFLLGVILAGLLVAVTGMGYFVYGGSNSKLVIFYNNLLTACSLCVLVIVVAVPRLARKYLATPNSRVLLVGTLLFALEALYTNLVRPLGSRYQLSAVWDWLGFAALLFSFGYVALQMVLTNERRLLLIEQELAIAREIQTSILPTGSPRVKNLRITATYRPMAAVAGDFYEFIPVSQSRIGFLLADVTGHGVPAALIAAMIKVAMQSVIPHAQDPRAVLRELNRILFKQLHEQFVSAAYLWLDTEEHTALYSAAGHPPLLRWQEGRLQRIVSNGTLFGIAEDSDYPVCAISFKAGDRFLLYSDGVTEPENAKGESFGDSKLEEILQKCQSRRGNELSELLLSEIQSWQPASTSQQDDITLIVVDVVEAE